MTKLFLPHKLAKHAVGARVWGYLFDLALKEWLGKK
jgi:hypothetical protein